MSSRSAKNASYYARTQATRLLKEAIKNVILGRVPNEATRARYGWGEREVNKIRALDSSFRMVLEDKHGVDLEDLYKGKVAKPPIRIADVQVVKEAVPPPRINYPQGLEETPAKGFNTPISWAQIDTFWSGPVAKHEMGSNAARKVMKEGELVGQLYAKSYTKAVRATFNMIREEFANQNLKDNAVPALKQVEKILAFLRDKYRKTEVQVEADRTVQDSAIGAVAGGSADDDEEVTSGPRVVMSKPATAVRARDKSSALKDVSQTYSTKIGHIVTTFGAWKVFRDSLGTDTLQEYRGTFGEGQVGLFQAIQADREVQGNKAKSDLHAVPSYEMLLRYLPIIRRELGPSTKYLAALLQVKLLGLRDNLGGIEIREDDGQIYDPSKGDSSRRDWYNRKTGRLYISHFKTSKARFGIPYDFQLADIPELKKAVDETLAPNHPESKRKWLVGVGVGSEKSDTKSGLPLPVGQIIGKAFKEAGLVFSQLNKGKLITTSPTPVDIRHAQVTWKHREMTKKNPSLTATQISEKIAGFFNHSSDINIGYLRKTFDSLDDPLARKNIARNSKLKPIVEEGPSTSAPKKLKIRIKMPTATEKKSPKSPKSPPPSKVPPPPSSIVQNSSARQSSRKRVPNKKYA